MRSRTLATGFGLLLAVATAPLAERTAFAQTRTAVDYPAACASVPASESERAHTLYGAGKAYYDDGNYEQAIAQFREAYKKDCSKHELLIIISRSYELHNERAEAIKALELYLERSPNAPDTQQQKTRIENLKRELAKERAAAAAAAAAAGPAAPKQEIREHTIPPWIVVGLGGATVIVGIVVLATAPSLPAGCNNDNNSCSKDPTGKETDAAFKTRQEQAGQAKDQPIYGAIAIGGGAILVAGGLLWHFLEPTGPVEAAPNAKIKPKLTPQIGHGYGGLSLGGTF